MMFYTKNKVFCMGIILGSCFIVGTTSNYFQNNRVRRVPYPTECCICDDYSSDPSRHCSITGICEKHFQRCDYCETVKNYTGTEWKTTRRCSVENDCIARWYQTVTTLGCMENNIGVPPTGTQCYSCCRTPSPLKPHYCTVSPDTHFIRFNLTTMSTTTTTTTTTMPTTTTTKSLAVDGGWSNWGPWKGCGTTCDGRRVRIRACDNPIPSGGGAHCTGSGFEEEWCDASNCHGGGHSIVG